jgi:hypothetical protein
VVGVCVYVCVHDLLDSGVGGINPEYRREPTLVVFLCEPVAGNLLSSDE